MYIVFLIQLIERSANISGNCEIIFSAAVIKNNISLKFEANTDERKMDLDINNSVTNGQLHLLRKDM